MADHILTTNDDSLVGGAGGDIFSTSSNGRLSETDDVDGGSGVDTLRFAFDDVSLVPRRLGGVNSIEALDLTEATTRLWVELDAHAVAQAAGDKLTLNFAANAMTLDVSAVGNAGTVALAGVGQVTLRGFEGQKVSVADGYDSHVFGGLRADTVTGGSGDDTFAGNDGDDILSGGAGDDTLHGGAGADRLDGGWGADVMTGGAGNDVFVVKGADVISGGAGSDVFRIASGADAAITDFEAQIHLERIDLRAIASATDFAQLTIANTGGGAQVTVGGANVVLAGVAPAQLEAGNFIFAGQADTETVFVEAGTSQDVIQRLIDEADAGTTIELGAGEFRFDHTLVIDRGDITLKGAGSGATVIKSLIGNGDASPTLHVESIDSRDSIAEVAVTGAKGANRIVLTSATDLAAGDILYLVQPNDRAFLAATGNAGLETPPDYGTAPLRYALREALLKVVAVNGDTVTLSEPLPYAFAAGLTQAFKSEPVRDVHIEGFRIETAFGPADPLLFENTRAAWNGIATVAFDNVADSSISDVATYNSGSHGFGFQRVYGLEGDSLHAEDSQNKGEGGNGSGFHFQEAFANHFTNISNANMRHGVLFSSWSAEHYNDIHVASTNRDINFHGSPDSDNKVVVDSLTAYYDPEGRSWKAVGPGAFPIHPQSTVEANDVRFRYLRSGDEPERLHAVADGADLHSGGGDDTLFGGAGADKLSGGEGDDRAFGAGGADLLVGGAGQDTLSGDAGDDTLRGGDSADILRGGSGRDRLEGDANADLVHAGAGDLAFGGRDSDTFIITGSARIADFAVADPFEKIDLRAIAAADGLAALRIAQVGSDARVTVGGVQLLLTDVAGSRLSAEDFVFVDDTRKTLAEFRATHAHDRLVSKTDRVAGTAGDDIFESSTRQLDADNRLRGGAGTDTLRFVSEAVRADSSSLAALHSVERLDVSLATGSVSFQIDAAAVRQADQDRLVVFGGVKDLTLDLSQVGDGGVVVAETFGDITLRNPDHQAVTVSDFVRGRVFGGSGDDTIFGGAQADNLNGGAGNDVLNGGRGKDTLTGGRGDDVFVVNEAGDRVLEAAGGGDDFVRADFTYALGARLEGLTLTGRAAIDGAGNALANTLTGNGAANTLLGRAGNDVLSGGDGNDALVGGVGADRLVGGVGADRLWGGQGADRFVFADGSGARIDSVMDFQNGKDRFAMTGKASDFRDLASGRIDGDGDGRADDLMVDINDHEFVILNTNKSEIDAGDFVWM